MRHAPVAAVLVCVLGISTAAGQDCQGLPPFQAQHVHFFLRGLFDNHTSLYGGGLRAGSSIAFGELNVEGVSVDSLGASAFTVGGGGGLQLPLNRSGTAHLCPIADATFLLGPNSYGGFSLTYGLTTHYRETDYAFGGAFGFIANGTTHPVKIIPTATYAYTNTHSRFSDSSGVTLSSSSHSSAILILGVGFLIGREVGVTPTISHKVGGSSPTVFGVRFAFTPGGTPPAIVNRRSTPCAGLTTTDSTIYDTTQVTERPTIRMAPELRYPPMQHDLLIAGRVILGVIVGSDGTPDSAVEVLSRVDPALDREAVRWVQGVTYWPACREGRPVRARIAQPVDFCLAGCPRTKS
jgi:TonB family protein